MNVLRALQVITIGLAFLATVWVSPAEAQFCGTCPTDYTWMGPGFNQPEFCSKCDAGYILGFYGDDYYCAHCPPGYIITPFGENYLCTPSGGSEATAVSWAKPYWAKVVWEKPSPGTPCPPGMFTWAGETPPAPPATPEPPASPGGGPGTASIEVCFECTGDGTLFGKGGYDLADYKHEFKGPAKICAGNVESGVDRDGNPYTVVTITENGVPWTLGGLPWRVRSESWKIEPPCNPASFFRTGGEACVAGKVPITGAATFASRAGAGEANTVRGDYICLTGGYVEIGGDAIRWYSCSDNTFQSCGLSRTSAIEQRQTRGNTETLTFNQGEEWVYITRH